MKILIGERSEHLTLDATVPSQTLGAAAEAPIAAAPLPIVQSLAHLQGHISRVLVEPRPGKEHALSAARCGCSVSV